MLVIYRDTDSPIPLAYDDKRSLLYDDKSAVKYENSGKFQNKFIYGIELFSHFLKY